MNAVRVQMDRAHAFWIYFTGSAFIAVGLAVLSGILERLGLHLLGLMFALWFVVLHLPRAFANVHHPDEWTSAFVALAMMIHSNQAAAHSDEAAADIWRSSSIPTAFVRPSQLVIPSNARNRFCSAASRMPAFTHQPTR